MSADNASSQPIGPAEPVIAERERKISPRIRRVLVVALVFGLIALGYWGINYYTRGRFLESTNNAYVQADFVTVAPKISGYVRQVLVAENQRVAANAPLLRIESGDFKSAIDRLRAEALAADADIAAARSQLSEQGAQLEQAHAQIAAAQTAVGYAVANVNRYRPLVAIGAEAGERYDNTRFDRDRALAELRVRQTALLAAQRRVPTLDSQVAQARARRSAINAQIATATNDLNGTVVRSSIAGTVGSSSVRVGQFVQPGQRLMNIVPSDDLYVIANFKETQLKLMRVGQPVTVSLDALGGVEIQGEVESLSPATGAEFSLLRPENATGNFTKIVQRVPVRIRIFAGPEARRLLRSGLSVEVAVDTRGARGDLDRIEEESRQQAKARG